MNEVKCEICGKMFSKYGIKNHIAVTHEGKKRGTSGKRAWNKGLTKETDERLKKVSEKLKEKIDTGEFIPQGFCSKDYKEYQKTEEYKLEQSKIMKEVVKNNPDSYSSKNVSGRVKNYKRLFYGEEFIFKGKWELLVAEKLFESDIKFTNEIQPIEYFWEESGKNHLYFPDFYLPEIDLYIEVKGYQRDRDLDKWASLDNLIVLKEKEINMLKNNISMSNLIGQMS